MWFSSKKSRIAEATQIVTTHKSAAVVVDSKLQIVAANDIFNQLSRRLNNSDNNDASRNLFTSSVDDSNIIYCSEGLLCEC